MVFNFRVFETLDFSNLGLRVLERWLVITCMASGSLGGSNEDLNSDRRYRWPEDRKVYTRRIRKKAQKACNGSAPAAVSVVENPSSAAVTALAPISNGDSFVPENPSSSSAPTTSSVRKEDSSVTVAVAAVDGSIASASEDANHCAVASPVTTTNGTVVETVASEGIDGEHDVQESPEAVVTKDVISDKTMLHQEHSLSGDSTHHQLQEDQQNLENSLPKSDMAGDLQSSRLPKSNDYQNLQSPSPHHSGHEMLAESGDKVESLREKSPVMRECDIPSGGEEGSSKLPNGDVAENNGDDMRGSSQVPDGNDSGNVNGVVKPLVITRFDDRIRVNLYKATPKDDIRNFRIQLENELDQVKNLCVELDSKAFQLDSHSIQVSNNNHTNIANYMGPEAVDMAGCSNPQPQHIINNNVDGRYLLKINSEGNNMGHKERGPISLARVNSDVGLPRSMEPRPYSRQLSVAVMENNHMSNDFFEKEKRTPKANQYYRNSEFLLGKDRLPSESNKRLKTSNGRKHNGEAPPFGFGFDKNRNQAFKGCISLLQRLMKHKYAWVFNEPVDAKALGLFDYHDIIKHPMDLGTIKTRLSQNWYKSPKEFAEDVRLVFYNAMTYNPKGQDVHVMAVEMLQIFEERWAIIESEYARNLKYQMYQDGGLPTPTSRKVASQPHFTSAVVGAPPNTGFLPASLQGPISMSAPAAASVPLYAPAAPQMRAFDRPEPTTTMALDPKIHRPHVGRTPVPRKPKAKDPDKRDMTYDEKQRLSNHLQGLPPEKLDAIVQIIKKRNTALSQNDDEIEVDIDRVDPETLWELDRFVTNYKKSLSKNKRKAELALQARMAANQNTDLTNSTPTAVETQIRSAAEKSIACGDGEKPGYDQSRSSSSSSSSSDSGSSSTDSDSDSSSADGSDAGQSPRT